MFDITFIGKLVATIASTGAFLALLGVLGAAAYVLAIATTAIERLPSKGAIVVQGQTNHASSLSWTSGTIVGLLTFVAALAMLRVEGWFATIVFSAALGFLARSFVALTAVLGDRAVERLLRHRAARAQELTQWRAQKAAEFQETNRQRLQGADLSAEVAHGDQAVGKLREGLGALETTRAALADKLKAALNAGGNVSLVADMARMRDDLDVRIDLGKRVLSSAEAAVAKLAYAVPVKRLLRLRPVEISGLDPKIPGNYAKRVESAVEAMDAYLVVIGQTKEEIEQMAVRRPVVEPAEGESLPVKARREIEAIESAYKAMRERADLVRLGLRAREGMARVANAAGQVAVPAEGQTDERDVHLLLDDVARANQMATDEFIGGDEHVRALATTLARGAKALSGGDRASLGEVVEALQSMG